MTTQAQINVLADEIEEHCYLIERRGQRSIYGPGDILNAPGFREAAQIAFERWERRVRPPQIEIDPAALAAENT